MPERLDYKLFRLCCDGEATPDQIAHLEQHLANHPEDREQIAACAQFERQLKLRIGAAMKDAPAAPDALRSKLQLAMSEAESVHSESSHSALEAEIAGRIGPGDGSQRASRNPLRNLFADHHRANLFAVAAALAIVAGAVLFGIFGKPIDDVRRTAPPADLASQVGMFADREHGECAGDRTELMSKLTATDPAKAEQYLGNWLGTPVQVFDLHDIGYEFVGAGPCDMPVDAHSGHMVYRKIVGPGERVPMLSVFVVRDQGCCRGKLCEQRGKWCTLGSTDSRCVHKVMRGSDGRLVYFLVCCDDRDLDAVTPEIQLASAAPARP